LQYAFSVGSGGRPPGPPEGVGLVVDVEEGLGDGFGSGGAEDVVDEVAVGWVPVVLVGCPGATDDEDPDDEDPDDEDPDDEDADGASGTVPPPEVGATGAVVGAAPGPFGVVRPAPEDAVADGAGKERGGRSGFAPG
jgi:hypothetical protein